ncbi:hypothetical protein BDF21DRAFT_427428 [Thamnidium elegans]|uniref:Zinc-ribbon 15 domain-containing protein n=1 Tax=Thamnidium elegans TaxID=101142 RepID=A0A8H7W1N7_9FUNG|nr:hypothetical protein INT48_004691 [Thamnidium elegans]KAI8064930.1 hypothetical protein BDF21DRAFT_427428 [Thamnidium elegans]
MAGSFTFVSKPGKKTSMEQASHPCPKCKHNASVQLIRSEKQWIIFNKIISSIMRVQYECSRCSWRNEELPVQTFTFDNKSHSSRLITYFNDSSKSTLSSAVY